MQELSYSPASGGKTRIDLVSEGRSVSHVEIRPITLRYGAATIPAAYIGDVFTEEAWRNRGFARRLLTTAIERCRAAGIALAILYGIGDFYHKFGYATVGADFRIELRHPERGARLSDGWQARPVSEPDVPFLQRLYDETTRDGTGQKVRPSDDLVWEKLRALARGERPGDECRVLVGPDERPGAYAWRGRGFWPVDHAQERYWPDDLTIGEVVASAPAGADAALAACRLWALEEQAARGRRVGAVHIGAAPESAVTAATHFQEASAVRESWLSAGPQARTLDAHRLLLSIAPELSRRAVASSASWSAVATLLTEAGSATLHLARADVRVTEPATHPTADATLRIEIGQATLARLVLGGFPPHDLLARCEPHVEEAARDFLVALFPQRCPYLHLLDR